MRLVAGFNAYWGWVREAVMRLLKELGGWVRGCSYRFLELVEYWLAPLTLMVVLAVVLSVPLLFWDSWRGNESGGAAIRNLILVIAAIIGLPLAIWRSKVAERQADTAQRGLVNERYQKGAEMLGSRVLSVRIGGIDALSDLALEHSKDYHMKVMSLLCAFARHPVKDEEGNDSERVREDVQEVIRAIHARSAAQIEIEKQGDYILNLPQTNLNEVFLRGANLDGANLTEANLNHALLGRADLDGADLGRANLRRAMALGVHLKDAVLTEANLNDVFLKWANLAYAHLTGADLTGADLTEASLDGADLTGADLRKCKGLTQEQLDHATAKPDNPPRLEGVVDDETGKPLVWRGEAVKQD